MDKRQIDHVIMFLNASWASKPLDSATAAIWGAELRGESFDAVMGVLRTLVRTSEWRPSLAQILRPLAAPALPPSSEAFARVWEQIGARPRVVSEIEAEAVRRMGGWAALGSWQLEDRHWHAKRFADVYGALVAAEERRALRGAEVPALEGEAPGRRRRLVSENLRVKS